MKDESVVNNLRQYGLGSRYVDVLVADASQSHVWRPQMLFDAIVADRKNSKESCFCLFIFAYCIVIYCIVSKLSSLAGHVTAIHKITCIV